MNTNNFRQIGNKFSCSGHPLHDVHLFDSSAFETFERAIFAFIF